MQAKNPKKTTNKLDNNNFIFHFSYSSYDSYSTDIHILKNNTKKIYKKKHYYTNNYPRNNNRNVKKIQ
jgi:hypothetical protein